MSTPMGMNPLARFARHLCNEARRALSLAKRYWIESLLSLGFVVSLFGGLLFAVLKVGDTSLASGGADGLIAGFAVWLFASAAAHGCSQEIAQETEQRSLEQLNLAPITLRDVLAVRLLLGLLAGLGLLALTLGAAHLLTAGRITLNASVLGIALLGVPALAGFGFALAGLMLLVKRGELLMVAAYPLMIGLVALPAYPPNPLAWLPYALSAAAARAAATGTPLPLEIWGWVGLNGLVYLVLGRWLFGRLHQQARRLGVLGHF